MKSIALNKDHECNKYFLLAGHKCKDLHKSKTKVVFSSSLNLEL